MRIRERQPIRLARAQSLISLLPLLLFATAVGDASASVARKVFTEEFGASW